MSSITSNVTSRPFPVKSLGRLLLGAAAGGAAGYAAVKLLAGLRIPLKTLSWFDATALWLAIAFFAAALLVFFLSTNRHRLARTLEGADAKLPATAAEVHFYRVQALSLALAAIMLLLPLFASAYSLGALRLGIFFAILALFAAQVATNIHLWITSDEFVRRLILTIGAITFAIGQGLLFLYAAAERLHLVRDISSWDVIVLLLALYFAANSIVSVRQTQR